MYSTCWPFFVIELPEVLDLIEYAAARVVCTNIGYKWPNKPRARSPTNARTRIRDQNLVLTLTSLDERYR